ncbi:MAG: beta-carotene 15,15'-dioxygenase, Brp/Blh family [Flavobacteriaceae bacterium]|nr:beta-carotene 15,15'-dioxygenase, Brp/Blh family [Flavobacteriaceae bacterium]
MYFNQLQIITSFFLLWIITQSGSDLEDTIGLCLTLTFGILHGANDLNLIQKKINLTKRNITILIFYLSVIVFSFFIALQLPIISFLTFIIISSFHFGEQHLSKMVKVKSNFVWLVYVFYGLLIFSLIFKSHSEFVVEILTASIGFYDWRLIIQIIFLCSIIGTTLIWAIFQKIGWIEINLFKELIIVFVLTIIFLNTTLLFSFAIYFIIWHAIPSIKDQIIYLEGKISTKGFIQYLKSSFIFWIISFAGALIILEKTKIILQERPMIFLALIFSFTLPHIFIISLISKNN